MARRLCSTVAVSSCSSVCRVLRRASVLKAFMSIDTVLEPQKLAWLVGVHLVFVISALMLALSDRWGSDR